MFCKSEYQSLKEHQRSLQKDLTDYISQWETVKGSDNETIESFKERFFEIRGVLADVYEELYNVHNDYVEDDTVNYYMNLVLS